MLVSHDDEQQSVEQWFGEQVRLAREARQWSQEKLSAVLAETAGIELHQSAIARLEAGKRAIRLNEAAALAAVLRLSLGDHLVAVRVPVTAQEYGQVVERRRAITQAVQEAELQLASAHDAQLESAVQVQVAVAQLQKLREELWTLQKVISDYRRRDASSRR